MIPVCLIEHDDRVTILNDHHASGERRCRRCGSGLCFEIEEMELGGALTEPRARPWH